MPEPVPQRRQLTLRLTTVFVAVRPRHARVRHDLDPGRDIADLGLDAFQPILDHQRFVPAGDLGMPRPGLRVGLARDPVRLEGIVASRRKGGIERFDVAVGRQARLDGVERAKVGDRPLQPLRARQALGRLPSRPPRVLRRHDGGIQRLAVALPDVVRQLRRARRAARLLERRQRPVEGTALLAPRCEQAVDLDVDCSEAPDQRPQAAARLHDEAADVAVGAEQRLAAVAQGPVVQPEEVLEAVARRGAEKSGQDGIVAGVPVLADQRPDPSVATLQPHPAAVGRSEDDVDARRVGAEPLEPP